ncbi:hypothetical protein C8F01DRAFT_1211126 [Mycena amicta]|nr:hypothetical protein C8F01DRAFT_1211126 [Mycena amicta]
MSHLHIHDADQVNALPRIKPAPRKAKIPVPFSYAASDDGTDENLLVLLHGLGDTHIPFFKLAKQLKLPQTAVLVLRAPEQIPFLYEEAYAWYPSFDPLGELLPRPNPSSALDLMDKTILPSPRRLESWAPSCTVSGPLLSYPTLATPSPTPILVAYRTSYPPGRRSCLRSERALPASPENKMAAEGGMPASKVEWEPIMRFWSENLGRRQVDGAYEVLSGLSS